MARIFTNGNFRVEAVINGIQDLTVGGRTQVFGPLYLPVQLVTANPGGGAGGAVQLVWGRIVDIHTVGSPGDSVILQGDDAINGAIWWIRNSGANACDIFPPPGKQIESGGVDVAYSLAAGTTVAIARLTDGENFSIFFG